MFDNILTDIKEDFLEIEVEGKLHKFDKHWLKLLAHYEVNLCLRDIVKISFIPCLSKVINLRCKYLMIFKRPIFFKSNYYIIPGYINYAIDKDKNIISISTGKILKSHINAYGYPCINIYDTDKRKYKPVGVHIFVARVFVKNNDPESFHFVNHRNGNKLDFKPSNLEWVNPTRNNTHAVENGFRKDNKPCKIRDIDNLEIKYFPSLTSCLKAIGYRKYSISMYKNIDGKIIPNIILNRYEIKYADDDTEWFYNKNNKFIKRIMNIGPYEMLNVINGDYFEADSIAELSKISSISTDRISYALRQIKPKTYDGFLIRMKSSDSWPVKYDNSVFYKNRKFLLKNILTGEEFFMESLRKTISFLNIDKRTLKLRLKRNQLYENWKIIEI